MAHPVYQIRNKILKILMPKLDSLLVQLTSKETILFVRCRFGLVFSPVGVASEIQLSQLNFPKKFS